jgi:hypothetical protein
MSQQVRGVVARAKGEPVGVETIVIPDPGPGEAVVKIHVAEAGGSWCVGWCVGCGVGGWLITGLGGLWGLWPGLLWVSVGMAGAF